MKAEESFLTARWSAWHYQQQHLPS